MLSGLFGGASATDSVPASDFERVEAFKDLSQFIQCLREGHTALTAANNDIANDKLLILKPLIAVINAAINEFNEADLQDTQTQFRCVMQMLIGISRILTSAYQFSMDITVDNEHVSRCMFRNKKDVLEQHFISLANDDYYYVKSGVDIALATNLMRNMQLLGTHRNYTPSAIYSYANSYQLLGSMNKELHKLMQTLAQPTSDDHFSPEQVVSDIIKNKQSLPTRHGRVEAMQRP